MILPPSNSYCRGRRISTVDLLALTRSDQPLLRLQIHFYILIKTSYLNEEVNCTEPSPSVRLPYYHNYYIIVVTNVNVNGTYTDTRLHCKSRRNMLAAKNRC